MATASKLDCNADASLFRCIAQEHSQPSAGGSRFDSNGHQFARTDHQMQTLFSENVFENTLMDDSSFTALLGLPTSEAATLLEQPSFCSETFPGDVLVDDWEQSGHFGPRSSNLCRENLAIGRTACLATIPSDPDFVEREAKFSTFANGLGAEESAPAASGISSGSGKEAVIGRDIVRPEESGKKFPKSAKGNRFKKRKMAQSSVKPANSEQVKAKRWKSSNANHENVKDDVIEDSKVQVEQKGSNNNNSAESIPKETEVQKNSKAPAVVDKSNYIHVRARRGQATDSHSLAERVRREKISERMKLLQDLVPGCSKITGKAVMLDEIINHVQCLQRQVEFLSMKLATVNPSLDFDMDHFFAEEMMNMAPCSGNSLVSREWTAPLSACLRYNNLEQASLQAVAMTSGSDVTSAWNSGLQNIFTVGLVRDRHSPFES